MLPFELLKPSQFTSQASFKSNELCNIRDNDDVNDVHSKYNTQTCNVIMSLDSISKMVGQILIFDCVVSVCSSKLIVCLKKTHLLENAPLMTNFFSILHTVTIIFFF